MTSILYKYAMNKYAPHQLSRDTWCTPALCDRFAARRLCVSAALLWAAALGAGILTRLCEAWPLRMVTRMTLR